MNHWRRKHEFCRLLRQTTRHLTRDKLKRLASIAVEDHRCCYKLILPMIRREARSADTGERLSLFYVLSDVLLTTRRQIGAQNRLTGRLESEAESTLKLFSSCPLSKRLKVLGWWAKCDLFVPEQFRRVRRILLADKISTERSQPSELSKKCNKKAESDREVKEEDCCSSPIPKRRKHCHKERVAVVKDRIIPVPLESQCSPEDCSFANKSTGSLLHPLRHYLNPDSAFITKTTLLDDLQDRKSPAVGPFGIPYRETWGFGEGRDGREALLHIGRTQSPSKSDWFKICAQIANTESTLS